MKTLELSDHRKLWTVRLLTKGDCYGLVNILTVKDEPLVEFWDAVYNTLVSRYYLSTLLEVSQGTGLNLDGGVPSWRISAEGMAKVMEWLKAETDPPMTAHQALNEFRLGWDSGDKWGSAMQALFAICEVLVWDRNECTPHEWKYCPGLGQSCEEDELEFTLARELSTEVLIRTGNVLNRYIDLLERYGHDY